VIVVIGIGDFGSIAATTVEMTLTIAATVIEAIATPIVASMVVATVTGEALKTHEQCDFR
jgi:hypothetical protein